MWQVGYTAEFVQVETELFALMVIFYFRVPLCSFGGSKCTRCSALAFTLLEHTGCEQQAQGVGLTVLVCDGLMGCGTCSYSFGVWRVSRNSQQMSSSLLLEYSFWLEKEHLSREIQFVMVPLTRRYLPGRIFKTRLHQLKPTALPCCERGKCCTMATLLPSLCDRPISLSPTAKHLHPALCLPAEFPPSLIWSSAQASEFPPSLICSSAQASAKWLLSSLRTAGWF